MGRTDNAQPGRIVLADGEVFEGTLFGATDESVGEAVFTTSMTGYQEILSDPSYARQIVVMTSPHIGNVGSNDEDQESVRPAARGLVVRDYVGEASNWRSRAPLHVYMEKHGIVGISGVDTRRLVRHLRSKGSVNAAMGSANIPTLLDRARKAPSMEGLGLVEEVSTKEPYVLKGPAPTFRVTALDYGMKQNIVRELVRLGAELTVLPATTGANDILATRPEGIFLSNGPGDPAVLTDIIATTKSLLGKVPIFGICLGHQILALALGAKTYKLKFGHRGSNQPVKHIASSRVEITAQNHGFAVDLRTLPGEAETTYIHLNDGSSEGLEVPSLFASSVQFHPEASGGPHDSLHLFDSFQQAIVSFRK